MHFKGITASLLFLLLAWVAAPVQAQEPQVRGSLSSSDVQLGQALHLTIEVTGARASDVPGSIDVDGLQITHTGEATNVTIFNMQPRINSTHTYTVMPMREGTFVIPGVTITAGGRRIKSQDLTLRVGPPQPGANAPLRPDPRQRPPAQQPQQQQQQGQGQEGEEAGIPNELVSAELVIPGNEIYLGQAVPVELRVYFRRGVRAGLESAPEIKGEGFTSRKFLDPRETESRRGGQPYQLVTFRTTLTPVKAGKVTVGPGELVCIVSVPERQGSGGAFGDDDFFSPFVFRRQQRVTIKSDPIELNVLPLPVENRPADFSGAVGQYELQATVTPLEANVGDPITIRSSVRGRGDFDMLSAPTLGSKEGFREYPATSKFAADDDLNLSGTRTFEQVVIPEKPMSAIPGMKLSFFDPVAKQYRTIESPPVPIKLSGAAPAAPTPAPHASSEPAQEPGPASTPPVVREVFHIFSEPGRAGSFVPFYKRTAFWAVNGAALAAWLGCIGFLALRRRNAAADPSKKAWTHGFASALRKAEAHPDDEEALIAALQHAAALRKGGRPEALAADTVVQALALPPEQAEVAGELFARRDARQFGGSDRQVAIDTSKLIAFLRRLK